MDTTRHPLQPGTSTYVSNKSDDREGQSTRDIHILENSGHNVDHDDSNMFNIDESDDTSTTANITANYNVHNIDNYNNVDVDDSNVDNVQENEEINTCQNTTIGNKNDIQNKPKKRNDNRNRKKQDRKWKERNRIQNEQYKQSRAMEKK